MREIQIQTMKKTPPKAKSARDWPGIIKWMLACWLFCLGLLVIADEFREMSLEYFLEQGLEAFGLSVSLTVCAILGIVVPPICLWLLRYYPRRFMGGVGAGVFVMLIAMHILKWRLNAFTPFQKDLAWLVMGVDLFCAVAIMTCAFFRNRLANIVTFCLVCNVTFFNVVTLANNVNGWEEGRFVVYFIGLIDVPLLVLLLSQLWRNDEKKSSPQHPAVQFVEEIRDWVQGKDSSISSSKKMKDE